jgi:anti-sigma B factor antagonist
MNPTQILIAVTETEVYLKLVGRANFKVSANFKSAVTELQSRGYRRFIVDLSECETMDSTMLGVLSAWALQLKAAAGPEVFPPIELWNPNARITSMLDDLGIKHLYLLREAGRAGLEYSAVTECKSSREALSQTSLEAHQTLMTIDPANIPKFKDVVSFLKEDLTRLRSPGGSGPDHDLSAPS